ncbi:hypothetical protein JVT61DRAFT_11053 [Boletus reticuloceps]|uniref:Uncharacterized protein n=1 Tax=Boletus reticuloceps TaxID=495285 RepID=A0A8I2YFF4_9AGAM|nr:hypothetical protein JVT61DRAFT_11053 [Boletus reticuloceps]
MCAYVDSADGKVKNATVCDFDPPFVDDPHEPLDGIELGSGTGVVAVSVRRVRDCHRSPGRLFPLAVQPRTTHLDQSDVVFVGPLAWGNLDQPSSASSARVHGHPEALTRVAHHALHAQVYFPELLGPLLRTLVHLTSLPRAPSSGPPIKIISYKIRSLSKETPFRSAFGQWFSFQPVLARRRVRPIEGKNAPVEGEPNTPEPWRQFVAHEGTDRTFVFVAHCQSHDMLLKLTMS